MFLLPSALIFSERNETTRADSPTSAVTPIHCLVWFDDASTPDGFSPLCTFSTRLLNICPKVESYVLLDFLTQQHLIQMQLQQHLQQQQQQQLQRTQAPQQRPTAQQLSKVSFCLLLYCKAQRRLHSILWTDLGY